jgi:hypothetical protein
MPLAARKQVTTNIQPKEATMAHFLASATKCEIYHDCTLYFAGDKLICKGFGPTDLPAPLEPIHIERLGMLMPNAEIVDRRAH